MEKATSHAKAVCDGEKRPARLIIYQPANPENSKENVYSWDCAAQGAAVGAASTHIAPDLVAWLNDCPVALQDSVRSTVAALVTDNSTNET